MSNIFLRREIYREDLEKLSAWLENPEVNEYLNEDENITDQLNSLIKQHSLPIFTPLLNRSGVFFMIEHPAEGTVGYLRLAAKNDSTSEMVIAIGDIECWGKGFGSAAIRQGLQKAFFDLRHEKVEAKIHPENERSLYVFTKEGFSHKQESTSRGKAQENEFTQNEVILELEQEEFIAQFL